MWPLLMAISPSLVTINRTKRKILLSGTIRNFVRHPEIAEIPEQPEKNRTKLNFIFVLTNLTLKL
jgi:hypothetical protein